LGRSFMRRWIGLSDCPGARLNYSRFPMVPHLRRQSREIARIEA
jgi:hypothetical protein